MAKKETLQEFIKNLSNYGNEIERETLNMWSQETQAAMGRAAGYAPLDIGTLEKSGRALKAKKTSTGIKSAFIFGEEYAHYQEIGISRFTGKPLNVKAPGRRSGYARKAVEEQEPFFIKGLKEIIGKVFNKI